MKIIENNNKPKIITPPVMVRCGHCSSIVEIEPGDAILNDHYLWEWTCPCCNSKRKSGSQWQMDRIKSNDEIKNSFIKSLETIKKVYPDIIIYIETPENVARCKIGDAMIYETPQGWIAIDAE